MPVAGFTGTRKGMTLRQKDGVYQLMKHMEVTYGHHGMCMGADAQFHQLCKQIRAKVIGHPPVNTRYRMPFSYEDFYRVWSPKPYLERDKDIVDCCQFLIGAPWDTEEVMIRSGTWATIRCARRDSKPLAIVWPNGQLSYENWINYRELPRRSTNG